MGGARISRDEILRACETVSKTGEKVTNESVRDCLGRGSYPTIGPVVKYFKDVLKGQLTGVSINPDSINKHIPHHTQYVPLTNIPRYMNPSPIVPNIIPGPNHARAQQGARQEQRQQEIRHQNYTMPMHNSHLLQNSNYTDYYSQNATHGSNVLAHNNAINYREEIASSESIPSEIKVLADEFVEKIYSSVKEKLELEKNNSNINGDNNKDTFINELHLELDNLRNTYARLESEVKILRDVNQKLDGHLRTKNSEVFILNKQLFKKESDVKDLVDRCARAEQELQIMKDRYPTIEKTKTILKKRNNFEEGQINTSNPSQLSKDDFSASPIENSLEADSIQSNSFSTSSSIQNF